MTETNVFEQKVNGMDKKIDTILVKMGALATDVTEVKTGLENLAISTKIGFDEVFERFDEITRSSNQRIENMEDDIRILKRSFR